jgi:hypothetical protein
MKDKALIGAIVTMVAIYLLVGFCVWDLNAKNWDIGARIMYSIFGTMVAGLVYSGIKMDQTK